MPRAPFGALRREPFGSPGSSRSRGDGNEYEDQVIGRVHDPGHTDKDPWPVRPPGRVEHGDNIANFAIDGADP